MEFRIPKTYEAHLKIFSKLSKSLSNEYYLNFLQNEISKLL